MSCLHVYDVQETADSPGSRYTSRSVEFLVIKLLASWRSLTSVHLPSSHNRVPSDFNDSTYQPDFGGNCDQPQYVRTTCSLFWKMIFRVMHLPKKLQPWVPSSARTKASPQSNARHVPINGQARRRLLEPPGSNTRVLSCFFFYNIHLPETAVRRGVLV